MPRKIWVSTTSFHGSDEPTLEADLEGAHRVLQAACALRPDIVCLPEVFATVGLEYEHVAELAQPVPGPITDVVAEVARRHSTYVICPLMEARDGRVYNSAVLIDRRGQIAGIYEKIHPVTSSSDYTVLEHGVTPGSEAKVFETDFGRLGVLICFDINWPEEWAELKRRGAEVVFWPSAYSGGFPLQVYAFLHSYYVVSSTHSDSRIIDLTGEILERTGRASPVVSAQIDLEKGVFHGDFNWAQIEPLRARYGRDVSVRILQDEALMTIESRSQSLAVAQIIEEMGLERLPDYLARNERAQDALRVGRKPPPQHPPYLGRQQYLA
jgi:beta-ureidopropionase